MLLTQFPAFSIKLNCLRFHFDNEPPQCREFRSICKNLKNMVGNRKIAILPLARQHSFPFLKEVCWREALFCLAVVAGFEARLLWMTKRLGPL